MVIRASISAGREITLSMMLRFATRAAMTAFLAGGAWLLLAAPPAAAVTIGPVALPAVPALPTLPTVSLATGPVSVGPVVVAPKVAVSPSGAHVSLGTPAPSAVNVLPPIGVQPAPAASRSAVPMKPDAQRVAASTRAGTSTHFASVTPAAQRIHPEARATQPVTRPQLEPTSAQIAGSVETAHRPGWSSLFAERVAGATIAFGLLLFAIFASRLLIIAALRQRALRPARSG
jgi:hypothetical protein